MGGKCCCLSKMDTDPVPRKRIQSEEPPSIELGSISETFLPDDQSSLMEESKQSELTSNCSGALLNNSRTYRLASSEILLNRVSTGFSSAS